MSVVVEILKIKTFQFLSFDSVTKHQLLEVRLETKHLRCKSDLKDSVLA